MAVLNYGKIRGFKWKQEVKNFFQHIKWVGGEDTMALLRSPGGLGQAVDATYDPLKFNLSIPSSFCLKDDMSSVHYDNDEFGFIYLFDLCYVAVLGCFVCQVGV